VTGRFNIATILVPIGLIFVGAVFLIIGVTGEGKIVPLIFGGLCVVAAIAAIIALVVSFFKKT
jgi:hypothetical protein